MYEQAGFERVQVREELDMTVLQCGLMQLSEIFVTNSWMTCTGANKCRKHLSFLGDILRTGISNCRNVSGAGLVIGSLPKFQKAIETAVTRSTNLILSGR